MLETREYDEARDFSEDIAGDSIQAAFEKFHADNPTVYETVVRLARLALSRGKKKGAIATMWEVVRWEFYLNTTDECQAAFKLNNNYRSRYARLVMDQEPDLKNFFNIRQLQRT